MDPAEALAMRPAFDRTRGVGGTDAAAIAGYSPYREPLDVWMEKTHHPMWSPKAETEAMRWGKLLEPVVRARYSAKTGSLTIPGPAWDQEPMWAEDGIRYFHADAYILGQNGHVEGLWEGKTSSDPDAWEDGVPPGYQIQVQQGMDICELPWTDVSVLIGGNDFRTYRIVSDPSMQAAIRTRVGEFWASVQTGLWDYSPLPTLIEFPEPDPGLGIIQADEELSTQALYLLDLKDRIAAMTKTAEETRDRIERIVKNHPGATGDGWYLDWKAAKAPQVTDWESIAVTLWNAMESIRRDLKYATEPEALPPKVVAMLDPKLYSVLQGLYTVTGKATRPFNLKQGARK